MRDVLVVGGGPVGLACAIEARLAGLSATVIEPRSGVIDKACGEGLMPGAVPLLARLGVDPEGMPLRGVRYVAGGRRAEHLFRTGTGRGVRRTALHSALLARAEQLGVERVTARVEAIEQSADAVVAGGIQARWLLGADGLHSTVRRLAGLERVAPRARRRFGMTRHYAVAPWTDLIEVHWAPDAELYVTPLAPDLVGVAMLGEPRTDFASVLRSVPALAGVGEATTSLRGAGPLRQRATAPSAGRVLLVGDASGYVDAITGEGLRLGFEQARLAVEHVQGEARYDREWARVTRSFRVLTQGLVVAATSPVRPAIVPLAAALPRVYGAVVERLAR